MRLRTFTKNIYFFTSIMALFSCDPGHHGEISIENKTSLAHRLTFNKYFGLPKNDSTLIIAPYSITKIVNFGSLGEGRAFDCCPCEFTKLVLQADTAMLINQKSNWLLINKNSKRFS
jgi:hypothetical protein